jgi:Icc-related predicted phosphoesterase
VLLCGDLTTLGEPEQAAVVASACAPLEIPIFAVLGNHDHHADRAEELVATLADGGIKVLDGSAAICEVRGHRIGVAGAKGFVGGFPGSHLPDFGERLLREVYAETSREVQGLDEALAEIAVCSTRIVMLHYAPILATIEGESPGIAAFLGSDRLAGPIAAREPDLVLHGHAHAGTFRGCIGDVPVFNVSLPVIGRDFWQFELDPSELPTAVH